VPQTQKISKNNTVILEKNGIETVILYQTPIVKIGEKTIELNTGGYNTATTRNRMNQVSNEKGLGFYVSSKAGKLTVSFNGKDTEFSSTIKLNR
jgi:hypothetical protein